MNIDSLRRHRNLLPYLVLVGAWALFFWRFAAPSPGDRLTFPNGDFTQQFGVFRDIAYRSLVAGRFPLWADCLLSGYPFHADPQSQIFYPPVWLVFGALRLLGFGHFPIEALVAETLVHYLFVSIGTFLFLRSIRLERPASLFGAVIFTYGGYLTGFPPLQTATLEVSAWLPLALLFAGRLAETGRARDLSLTAAMLALAFLAGHPQTFVYVALLTLAYFAFRASRARWRAGALAGGAAALVALTAGVSTVQLLPSAEFILNSTRAAVAFEQASNGFPLQDIVQFFLTGLVSHWHPLYVGILPLALALMTLRRPLPQIRFWAGVALVGLLLSMGTKAIAYDVAYWTVPGYRLFRDQERLALAVSFALAVLAAFGAQDLLGPLTRLDRRWLARVTRVLSVLWVVALLLLGAVIYLSRMGIDPSDSRRLPEHTALMVLGLGLALTALLLRARVPAVRRWLPAIVLGAAVLNLFSANRSVNPVPPFETYPHDPLLDAVRADTGFFRVQDDYRLPGHAGCGYGFQSTEGITPYRLATYTRFLERAPELARWQLLGVRYLVTWRAELYDPSGRPIPSEVLAQGSVPDEKGNYTKTFRLDLEPRRAFLVHRAEVAGTDDALYARLAAPDFDPLTSVLVPEPIDTTVGGNDDRLSIALDLPGRLRVLSSSAGAGVLVASQVHFPGWRATLDGQPVPLLRADGALMAVGLPAGSHEIEFLYRPARLLWGGILSFLSTLLLIGLFVRNPRLFRA